MARSSLLNTDTEDLKELLANGKTYGVPPYQRDYSWRIEHWEDLWEDICALEKGGGDHYMGSIVLQSPDGKNFRIIDGQQRIATLSILLLAGIDYLHHLTPIGREPSENKERAALLESAFIGARDPVSLRVVSKLTLNAGDDNFYQLNLVQRIPPAGGIRNLTDSEKLLWECFQFFRQKLAVRFGDTGNGETIAEFINNLVTERLLFTCVRVRDELSAYTVFETLNARGLELSEPDLLKNYLLSLTERLSKSQIDPLLRQWNRITDAVGAARLPEFMRHYLNSYRRYVRRKDLFRTVKSDVTAMEDVFTLLNNIENDAVWFQALYDCNNQFWLDFPGAREWVRVLNLFGAGHYIPMALAAKNRFQASEMAEVLRYCAIVSFRFNGISQRSTHIVEETYNAIALTIRKNEIATLADVRRCLGKVYIPDDEFESDFSVVSLKASGRSGKCLRYILCELEKHLAPKDLSDETSPNATIEHILPENPSEEWLHFFTLPERERYTARLGNYTLLEKSLNSKDAGNAPYRQKKDVFQKSGYFLTRGIIYDDWNPAIINKRQREMARAAKTIWKLEIPH